LIDYAGLADDYLQGELGTRVDGLVTEGRSSVDESMVTGESMPVTKEKDAKVVGGTINRSGTLVIRAEKLGRLIS